MKYTVEELHKEVTENPNPFGGVPNIVAGKNSSNKPSDWWKKEDTPEATEEHTKHCFQSLEQQGKLKMPDHTKGEKKIGKNKDYTEYSDR